MTSESCKTRVVDKFVKIFRKSERKRPLGRYKVGWEDNIKMNHKEIGYDIMNSIHGIRSNGGLLCSR